MAKEAGKHHQYVKQIARLQTLLTRHVQRTVLLLHVEVNVCIHSVVDLHLPRESMIVYHCHLALGECAGISLTPAPERVPLCILHTRRVESVPVFQEQGFFFQGSSQAVTNNAQNA